MLFYEYGVSSRVPASPALIDWILPIPHSSLLHIKSLGLQRAMGIYVPSAPTDWLTAQTARRLGQGGRKREEKETGMERNRLMEIQNGL